MSVVVVGLSHRTAPVEIRDAVAILQRYLRPVLGRVRRMSGVAECAVLSTCNRTEAYLLADDPEGACETVVGALCRWKRLDPDALSEHLFVYRDVDAVRHLFEVASGLDSMVMGEPQIAGQVKDAGTAAMDAGASRTILNRLFQSAIQASKRARTETEIGAGAVSVSFAAVELARKIFGDLGKRSALVVGAGEMSEITAKHLVEYGVRSLTVTSRTLARAQDLAERVGGLAVAWDEGLAFLGQADVVISSTGAQGYVLDRAAVARAMQRRRNDPMFLIDIAVPRDIEPEAGDLDNVFLYDIDDLQSVAGANLKKRQKEAEKAREILKEEVGSFQSWVNSLEVMPAIVALRKRFQSVLETELSRAKMSDLTDDQRAKVADLLRRYMNTLLHRPMVTLKAAADTGDGLAYIDSLMHLFDLQLGSGAGITDNGDWEKSCLEGVKR